MRGKTLDHPDGRIVGGCFRHVQPVTLRSVPATNRLPARDSDRVARRSVAARWLSFFFQNQAAPALGESAPSLPAEIAGHHQTEASLAGTWRNNQSSRRSFATSAQRPAVREKVFAPLLACRAFPTTAPRNKSFRKTRGRSSPENRL